MLGLSLVVRSYNEWLILPFCFKVVEPLTITLVIRYCACHRSLTLVHLRNHWLYRTYSMTPNFWSHIPYSKRSWLHHYPCNGLLAKFTSPTLIPLEHFQILQFLAIISPSKGTRLHSHPKSASFSICNWHLTLSFYNT